MLKTALLTIGLSAMSGQVLAADAELMHKYRNLCSALPPLSARQEPTVKYDVYRLSAEDIQKYCGATGPKFTACAVSPYKGHPDGWAIFITSPLSDRDYDCVLMYEKAHLPPNNWIDPRWENYLREGR